MMWESAGFRAGIEAAEANQFPKVLDRFFTQKVLVSILWALEQILFQLQHKR